MEGFVYFLNFPGKFKVLKTDRKTEILFSKDWQLKKRVSKNFVKTVGEREKSQMKIPLKRRGAWGLTHFEVGILSRVGISPEFAFLPGAGIPGMSRKNTGKSREK